METIYTFRNLETTDALRQHADSKIQKLNRYLIKPTSAHVIFSLDDKFHHKAELTIVDNGTVYVGSEKSSDMYLSIDRAFDKLEKQLKKNHDRIKKSRKGTRVVL